MGNPRRVEKLKIKAMTKSGEKVFQGAVVNDMNPYTIGIPHPYKGGIRYKCYASPKSMLDVLMVLARDMTYKCALFGLPFGGGKTCVNVDPLPLTSAERKYITQGLALEMLGANILGYDIYVPGPDMGTDEEIMKYFYLFCAKVNRIIHRPNIAAICTGKPVEFDGIPGRSDATSRGGLIIYSTMTERATETPTFTIQGAGNVGMNVFKLLSSPDFEVNGKVIAISDVSGGLYDPNGLNFGEINEHYTINRTFEGYNNARHVTKDEVLRYKTDALFSAAAEGLINKDNAADIETSTLVELGNAAVTDEAEQILEARGIKIIPDIFANAGGVIVSSFEFRINLGDVPHYVDRKDLKTWVHDELREIMKSTAENVREAQLKYKTNLRTAAYIIAQQQLEFVMKKRNA